MERKRRVTTAIARTPFGLGTIGLGVGLLALACAAPADTYWTRGKSSEKDFRLANRWCSEKAEDDGAGVASRSCTTTTAYGGGTYCQEEDPNTFENQQRRARQVQRSYAQCMEKRGWKSNTEGEGYKGEY